LGSTSTKNLFETRKEIKVDIFVSQFTELVRYFDIIIGESIQIKADYKLWFMGKEVNLEDTFLNISDDIEFTLPCSTRHIELLMMTYVDFDRKYLICPEETLFVYGLLKEVDSYIDLKLGRFPLNEYQQNQMSIAKSKFIEGYLKINENSLKSKELLKQHDDGTEEPLNLKLGSIPIKQYLVKNENRLCFKGKEKEGIEKLSKKIQFKINYKKEPISIFSNDKEVTY
jgi:hypothetical protein